MSKLGLLRRLAMFTDDVRAHSREQRPDDYPIEATARDFILEHCEGIATCLQIEHSEEQQEADDLRARIQGGA